ncbi:MAG: hypothetical protein HQM10_04530 [Candidatus Riflebacteria bacterium]|nr:hypothetical protein [Candidatus Riflebacteria bacterium]
MDRVLSVCIDDAIYQKINDLSLRMRLSKKSIIDKGVELLWQRFEKNQGMNVFDETCGIWKRNETPEETVLRIRSVFGE